MKTFAVIAFALITALVTACSPDSSWVARVERAHRDADAAAARGDYDGARAALRALSEAGLPSSVVAADRQRIEQDLYFRRAALALQAGDAALAQSLASQGLALGTGDDPFSVNLWVIRGRAREQLRLTEQAAEDYHRALLANEALLTQALNGSDDPDDADQNGGSE